MAKSLGYVLYDGPSLFDQKPIVVIATTTSSNRKTGNVVNTWIMRSDIEPHTARKQGDDESVCGDCKHRINKLNTCYVLVHQAPLSVFRAYKRGRYDTNWNSDSFANQMIRLGSYGDPAAVPTKIWTEALAKSSSHTGYTHQWNNKNVDQKGLMSICMASVDSVMEREIAKKTNWRTFRCSTNTETETKEMVCLNVTKGTHCGDCRLCYGSSKAKDILVPVHGNRSKKFKESS